uniref:Uncharacterized protein n=1 Tax=Lophocladia kuetzingii TaxID=675577 RepID=A0A1Z1MP38_9FLOR|nr:hypothetical protein [Lophocladia kuetzingii]ARW67545.1 hypothetical protein [Lophocladia kuetzingii]
MNNLLLFHCYLSFALLFLIPLSIFITFQLKTFFSNLLNINQSFKILLSKHEINQIRIVKLYRNYVTRKQWFKCTILLELCYQLKLISDEFIYMSLAYCYQSNSYYNIAKYYYLQVLNLNSSNIIVLKNLIQIYNQLGDEENALDISKIINSL